jgi:hypothetical protein
MLLRHIGLLKQAAIIENALLATLEDGVHTGDVRGKGEPVGTDAFASAIVGAARQAAHGHGGAAAARPGRDDVRAERPGRTS